MNNFISQINLLDNYKPLLLRTVEFILVSNPHATFTKIKNIQDNKTSLNTYIIIYIICYIFNKYKIKLGIINQKYRLPDKIEALVDTFCLLTQPKEDNNKFKKQNNQNCQKIKLYGSPTIKELKKKHYRDW